MGFLGGGNSNMFLFSPRKLGKIHILTNIFQRGWNYQLFFCATSSVFFDIGVFNGNMIIDSTRKGGGVMIFTMHLWFRFSVVECVMGCRLVVVSKIFVDLWRAVQKWDIDSDIDPFEGSLETPVSMEILFMEETLHHLVEKTCHVFHINWCLPGFPSTVSSSRKKNRKQTVFSMFFALPKGLFTDVNVQWRSVPKQRFSM